MSVIDRQNPLPIYQQLAGIIRKQVQSGEFKPGDRLTSELDLAGQYQISRDSVRRALDLLVKGGLVQRVHGKGYYVQNWLEVQSSGGLISFLVPDTRVFLFMNMLNGVVNAANSRGYSTIIGYLGNDVAEEKQNMDQLKTRGVSGFVIFPRNNLDTDEAIEELFHDNFPFVIVDRFLANLPCSFVGIDNIQAAYQAVSYLITKGYRTIGFATWVDMKTTTIQERYEGYRKALSDHHIEFQPEWLLQSPSSFASPIYAEEEGTAEINNYRLLLRRPQRPRAILSINDMTAYLVSKAAKAEGIRVPQELALVGFDNDVFARQAEVPLTTVAQPFEEMGARAAHLLIDRLRGAGAGYERILLPTQLIVRQSCGEGLPGSPQPKQPGFAERRH